MNIDLGVASYDGSIIIYKNKYEYKLPTHSFSNSYIEG